MIAKVSERPKAHYATHHRFGVAGIIKELVESPMHAFPSFYVCICLLFARDLSSLTVASLLFCQCGSDRVDLSLWNGRRPRIRCLTCSHEAWLDGFTVSDFDPGALLAAALVDQARKHRKRPPEEVARIASERAVAAARQ